MVLGLKKGKVTVEPYDPEWHRSFTSEAETLLKLFGGWIFVIEHFGSTAIPLCEAKPILDIAAVIPMLSLGPDELKQLRRIGYGTGWIHILPDRICLTKGSPVTHHLYFVTKASTTLASWLQFRDQLRGSPDLRLEYVEIKRKLASQHPDNRLAYTEGKSRFVHRVLKLA